ncbi:Tripartite-type tricarboxylate transporter, receptor component TctC [Noviherbaspirillum humi]|uniref:Tripartite-type tricarboxylate transporter, receptor component TctC n=1 Tax=Noviherbaspirillum humi TaxID=1688639 RepID=A0A239LI83_9BURK|nr:tripartite tricarboxylate transporter substrate binding protein [Noviherbaspirillum humi]SNT30010.1 Tripartite-type tricarboxylate transporter, receptor component TctC [Noviherbaspirillum humi]
MGKAIPPLAVLAACLAAAPGAQAQSYPSKPIKLVVGFTPGGAADFTGRVAAEALSKVLGQSIIIENKPGAGSSIAAEFVAKAPPDGYTILIASPSSMSVNPAMNPKKNYGVNTLVPITRISNSPLILTANPALGINSLKDLVAAARKSPGKLNYSTSGNGSAPHLGAVYLKQATGIDIQHVPYKGGAQAVQAVIAGDVELTFATPPSVLPFIKANRLKGLAVSTPARSAFAPDIPGMTESGYPGFNMNFWYGFFAPAGTPPEVVNRLFEATSAALQKPEVKTMLAREATEVALSRSPADFEQFLKEDARFWEKLVKDSGITAD